MKTPEKPSICEKEDDKGSETEFYAWSVLKHSQVVLVTTKNQTKIKDKFVRKSDKVFVGRFVFFANLWQGNLFPLYKCEFVMILYFYFLCILLVNLKLPHKFWVLSRIITPSCFFLGGGLPKLPPYTVALSHALTRAHTHTNTQLKSRMCNIATPDSIHQCPWHWRRSNSEILQLKIKIQEYVSMIASWIAWLSN